MHYICINDPVCIYLNGKIGDLITLYPGYGYRGTAFNCIKMGSKTVNVYAFDRYWYSRDQHQTPVLKLTKDCITFLKARYRNTIHVKAIGDWSQALGYQARAFGDYSTAIGFKANAIEELKTLLTFLIDTDIIIPKLKKNN